MSGLDDDEESKQEETLTEAHRDGNMALLGDRGGSQSVLVKVNFPKSQPAVLGKRENPEEGGDGDYNSLVASAITYKR